MTRADGPILVLGIGNLLLSDEGVGVRVIERLGAGTMADAIGAARATAVDGSAPVEVALVDGGTLGLDLLPLIDGARALVLVDAVNLRAAPGTVTVVRGGDIHAALGAHLSPHQVGVSDLVAVARLTGQLPDELALVAVQPGSIEVGLELTGPVRAAVDTATRLVVDEIARLTAHGAAA